MKIDKYVKDLWDKMESFSSSSATTNCNNDVNDSNDSNNDDESWFAVIVKKHISKRMNALKRNLERETGGAYLATGFIVIMHNAMQQQ